MLSREELLHLFDRFSTLISRTDVKKRIADAVSDNQEAVAVTTAIQEEILQEMGVDPAYGLSCLGKINMEYENDQDLMVRFYGFVANDEMACEEAELGPEEYSKRLQMQQNLHQREMEEREKVVKHMWDVYTNSRRIKLPRFWQEAFVAAYEDLTSDALEVREAAISEIAKMSLHYIDLHLPPPTLQLTSMIGHCLGAAGGLEGIATVKSIQTGWLHPSINQYTLLQIQNSNMKSMLASLTFFCSTSSL